MTNPQGTQWETEIVNAVNDAESYYHSAGRYPKRAQKAEPDVWIGVPEPQQAIPIVIWKRLAGKKAEGRRKPDGERAVVVMGFEDFIDLLDFIPMSFEVQAKWTTNLNVTRTLHELRTWMRENR